MWIMLHFMSRPDADVITTTLRAENRAPFLSPLVFWPFRALVINRPLWLLGQPGLATRCSRLLGAHLNLPEKGN